LYDKKDSKNSDSVYEFSTAGPAASAKIYYDEAHAEGCGFFARGGREYAEGSLLGISRFPEELCSRPKLWHETMGKVVYMREHERGGHFAAYEVPEVLVRVSSEMFGRGGLAEGCVDGRSWFGDENKGRK